MPVDKSPTFPEAEKGRRPKFNQLRATNWNQSELQATPVEADKSMYFCVVKWFSFFLALYFLLGSFLPRADWEELPKVAVLLDHYHEHKADAPVDYSFLDFLWSHYVQPDAQGSSDAHNQLPFFQHNLSPAQAIIPSVCFHLQLAEPHLNHLALPVFLHPRQPDNAIFQPPRA